MSGTYTFFGFSYDSPPSSPHSIHFSSSLHKISRKSQLHPFSLSLQPLSSAHLKLDSFIPSQHFSHPSLPWPPCCQRKWRCLCLHLTHPRSILDHGRLCPSVWKPLLASELPHHPGVELSLLSLDMPRQSPVLALSPPATLHVGEPRAQAWVLSLHHPHLFLGDQHLCL